MRFMCSNMITGMGLVLFMVPLSTYALATLEAQYLTEGSGLFSYGRMLGASIGISLFSTLVSRSTQTYWNQLGLHINQLNPNLRVWLQHSHRTLNDPHTIAILQKHLFYQSNMLAFLNAYHLISYGFLVLIPLVLAMKTVRLSHSA